MIIRQDLKRKSEESLKHSLMSECNLIEIRIVDKTVVNNFITVHDCLPPVYYVKDISGRWFYCCESLYKHLLMGKRYVLKEYRRTIIGLFSELED